MAELPGGAFVSWAPAATGIASASAQAASTDTRRTRRDTERPRQG
jgi:hypothetical protein